MKIVVYGAGVMAQYVKESVINSGNEFVGFVDPLGRKIMWILMQV